MRRNRKVKRFDTIYSHRKKRKELFFKILITVLILLAIVVLTFFVASGIFNQKNNRPPESETSSSAESSAESSQVEKTVVEADKIQGTELPVADLQNKEAIQAFVKKAKEKGCNTIVVPLKGASGELLYHSSSEKATAWNTVSAKAVDAKEIAQIIQGEGLMPMAHIYAFEDKKAGDVKYDNTYTKKNGTIWTDNNGASWLNPYKDAARNYITDIVKELGGSGFERVLIQEADFPKNMGNAVTGSGGLSKEQILEQFYQELNNTQVPYTIAYPWDTITGGNSKALYGGDPTTYTGAQVLSPMIDMSSYPNGYQAKGKTLKGADLTAYIMGMAKKSIGTNSVLLPVMVQSGGSDAIRQGLESIDIHNYIVLS